MTSSQSSLSNVAQRPQQPALDGIRAIAIIGVYVFHVWPDVLPGGFTGVDVFFVLSGFLITSIIRQDLAAGTFSFREFYLRRIQRLLPNAALTVGVTVLFALYFLPAGIANQAGRHGLWNLLNLSNIFAYRNLGDYWGDKAENVPLTHFWSLGVEEQFYIIFPLTLFLLWKLCRRWTPFILAALAILSFILCYRITAIDIITGFYLPQYRFWELLAGAVLACFVNLMSPIPPFPPPHTPHFRALSCLSWLKTQTNFLGFLGVALILFSFIVSSNRSLLLGRVPLFAVLGSALLIYSALSPQTLLNKFFSLRPLTAIGKVSYSLYLWHWPAIIFGALISPFYFRYELYGRIAGGVVGILLGTFAYFVVEQPLRRRTGKRKLRLALIAALFVVSFSLSSHAKKVQFDFSKYNIEPICRITHESKVDKGLVAWMARYPYIKWNYLKADAFTDDKCGIVKKYNSETPEVVVYGDSKAEMYIPTLEKLFAQYKITAAYFWGHSGAGMMFADTLVDSDKENTRLLKGKQNWKSFKSHISQWHPKVVIFSCYLGFADDYDFENLVESFLVEQSRTSRTKFVFVTDIYKLPYGHNLVEFALLRKKHTGGWVPIFPIDKKDNKRGFEINRFLEELPKRHKNCTVIPAAKIFIKPDGSIRYAEGKSFLYSDSTHLSIAGAELVRPLFEKTIREFFETQTH